MHADSMTRFTALAIGVTLTLLGAAIAAQPGPASSAQQRPAQPAPAAAPSAAELAAGEAATRRICSTACHNFEHVITVRRTRAQWEATIENMIGRGAKMTSAEAVQILD